MKLSDIKGPVADAVNSFLYKEYEKIIYEFNKKLDPTQFKIRLKATSAYHSWEKGKVLFEYVKELKEFLSKEICEKTEFIRIDFRTREELLAYTSDIKQTVFNYEYQNELYNAKGKTEVYIQDGQKYSTYYVGWYTTVTIKLIDRNAFLKAAENSINEKSIKKKPLKDMRGVEYKIGDTVAFSDSSYAAVQLGLVTKLTDLRVEVSKHINGSYIVYKEPKDMLIVSPFIQFTEKDTEVLDEVF